MGSLTTKRELIMPYIKNDYKEKLNPKIEPLADLIESNGELNYVINMLMYKRLKKIGLCYENFNGLMGSMICAMLEFYRRIGAPYEDVKKEENGDVF